MPQLYHILVQQFNIKLMNFSSIGVVNWQSMDDSKAFSTGMLSVFDPYEQQKDLIN